MRRAWAVISVVRFGVAIVALASACNRASTPAAEPPMPSGPPVTFRGVVLDNLSGQRLQNTGIEIAVVGNVNKPFAGTVTDDKGEFTFAPLPAGEYMIRVAHQGHLELQLRIEAKPDQDKPLDIRLRTNVGVQRCVASRYHTPDCP